MELNFKRFGRRATCSERGLLVMVCWCVGHRSDCGLLCGSLKRTREGMNGEAIRQDTQLGRGFLEAGKEES